MVIGVLIENIFVIQGNFQRKNQVGEIVLQDDSKFLILYNRRIQMTFRSGETRLRSCF